MQIQMAPPRESVLALLHGAGLPTEDITEELLDHFLSCGNPANPCGIVGLEIHGPLGLLRSLVVAEPSRSRGCGEALVRAIEEHAEFHGLEELYLLTETADKFFQSLGYLKIARSDVPKAIQKTHEFSTLCPVSARVMKKKIMNEKANILLESDA